MHTLRQDLRYAVRRLIANPGFTAAVALTLALGIGANTAIFSIIRAVLLRPLPYADSGRVVTLWQSDPRRGIERDLVTPANYADWRHQNQVFEDIAISPAWGGSRRFNIVGKNGNEQVSGAIVSAALFPILRVQPILGRTFTVDEDHVGAPLAAVLSHSLWQRDFGGDPKIVGKTLTVDTYGLFHYTVVGVMPPGFRFPDPATELWLSIGWMGGIKIPPPGASDRCCSWFELIARLKPGVTLEQARAQMNLIAGQIARQHPETRFGPQVAVAPLLDQMVDSARMQLLLLLAAVGCVLLIGCANVANLLLSRTAGRRREIAIRLALGATRGALFRQLLIESCVLALVGGAAGLLLAMWGVEMAAASGGANLPGVVPRIEEARLDGVVLGFSLLLSLATGILSGLAPALYASKADLNIALKEGAAGAGEPIQRRRLRGVLVVSELALTLALLSSAGLLLRSFLKLNQVDPGFHTAHVLTVSIDMSSSTYSDRERSTRTLFRGLMDRIRTMPGVRAVGGVTTLPLAGGIGQAITVEGQPLRNFAESPMARTIGATASYFHAMGVPLLEGRLFTDGDQTGAPEVVVVNETMARRYWPGLNPHQVVGRRLLIGSRDRLARLSDGRPDWMEIVGVVGNVRGLGLDAAPVPELYMSYRQWPWHAADLVVRSDSEPLHLASAIRAELHAMSQSAVVTRVRTMEQLRSDSIAQPRLRALLLMAFSGVAVLLAAIGIYGVISYSVAQRTREIGIRMAMGAQPRDVLFLVLRQGMVLVAIGIACGLAASLASARLLSRFLFDLSAHDPATLACVTVLLTALSCLAICLPARRATRIDPMVALRE